MLGRGLDSLIPPQNNQSQKNASGAPDFSKNQTDSNLQPARISEINIPKKEEQKSPLIIKQEESFKNFPELPEPENNPSLVKENEEKFNEEKELDRKYRHRQYHEAVFQIETEKIKPNPFQPRKHFDEESLKELASSIREFGIIQPLVVSKVEKEVESGTQVEYQLVAGERRLMAAKILGLERVPAIIRRISKKAEQMELAIVENLQRENLNPIETARAYARLQDEFGLTQREIASRLGKSREVVANTLRLLNLPTEIQEAVSNNKINESQARLILAIADQKQQISIFNELVNSNLSVRELRSRIRKDKSLKTPDRQATLIDPEMEQIQEQLAEILGTPVKIEKSEKGGKIIIPFYSEEEVRGIIEKLEKNNQ